MKFNLMLAAAAALVSFAVVVAASSAAKCTHLSTTCPGWGAEEPKVEGYCCIPKYSMTEECGTGVMSATKSSDTWCGQLAEIVGNQCGEPIEHGCDSMAALGGCTSANCPE